MEHSYLKRDGAIHFISGLEHPIQKWIEHEQLNK